MKRTKERGSVTLFAVCMCLFVSVVLVTLVMTVENKKQAQRRQIDQIAESYEANTQDMEQAYQKVVQKVEEVPEETGVIKASQQTNINAAKYIGKYVNYGQGAEGTQATKSVKWRILDITDTNIYLIAEKCVKIVYSTKISGISSMPNYYTDFDVWVTTKLSNTMISYLTNSNSWKNFALTLNGKACTATGGPTIDQILASYNKVYSNEKIYSYKEGENYYFGLQEFSQTNPSGGALTISGLKDELNLYFQTCDASTITRYYTATQSQSDNVIYLMRNNLSIIRFTAINNSRTWLSTSYMLRF